MSWTAPRNMALQPHTEALIAECFDALLRRAVVENDDERIVSVSKAIVDFAMWRQRIQTKRDNRKNGRWPR